MFDCNSLSETLNLEITTRECFMILVTKVAFQTNGNTLNKNNNKTRCDLAITFCTHG